MAYARPALHRLADASAGNPFFAIELARVLGKPDMTGSRSTPLPVPSTLHELVTDRLAGLPRETLDLLVYVAAASRPVLATVAAAACVEPAPLLEPAWPARIVVIDDDAVRFAHPLFAAAAYGLADAKQRRRVHRRLADASDEVEERARHLALAVEVADEEVAYALEAAAARTRIRGDRVVSAQLFQDAARLTPETDLAARSRRLLAGAGALFEAGDSNSARSVLERVLADDMTGNVAAEARWRLGTVLAETGSREGSMRLWEEALALAQDPELSAEFTGASRLR